MCIHAPHSLPLSPIMINCDIKYAWLLQEVASGAAQTTLEALQDILDELTHTASYNGHSEASKTILANIKSSMSHRASAQKSFYTLLQEYKSGILPSVIKKWENITIQEQQSMTQMFNFFCGMHLIVNMAQHVLESLKQAHPTDTECNI